MGVWDIIYKGVSHYFCPVLDRKSANFPAPPTGQTRSLSQEMKHALATPSNGSSHMDLAGTLQVVVLFPSLLRDSKRSKWGRLSKTDPQVPKLEASDRNSFILTRPLCICLADQPGAKRAVPYRMVSNDWGGAPCCSVVEGKGQRHTMNS